MEPRYRIKTPNGYYFEEGTKHRRYGRMYGTKEQAAIMCPAHTDQLMGALSVAYEEGLEKELVKGWIACPHCKKGV